jgi:hypothetical protein
MSGEDIGFIGFTSLMILLIVFICFRDVTSKLGQGHKGSSRGRLWD